MVNNSSVCSQSTSIDTTQHAAISPNFDYEHHSLRCHNSKTIEPAAIKFCNVCQYECLNILSLHVKNTFSYRSLQGFNTQKSNQSQSVTRKSLTSLGQRDIPEVF